MLKEWTLHRFKSVYDRTHLPLAPLTVFVGANSSGKSTVIQSLLLTAQTLQNPVPSRSVVLNGHILKLGAFDDVVSNAAEDATIGIGFRLEPDRSTRFSGYPGSTSRHFSRGQETIRKISCAFSFGPGAHDPARELAQLQPRLEDCELTVSAVELEHGGAVGEDKAAPERVIDEIVHVRRSKQSPDARLRQYHVGDTGQANIDLASLEYDVVKPATTHNQRRFYGMPRGGKNLGTSLFHFLPARFVVVYDAVEDAVDRLLETLVRGEAYGFRDLDLAPEVRSVLSEEVRGLLLELLSTAVAEARVVDAARSKRQLEALAALSTGFSVRQLQAALTTLNTTQRRLLIERVAEREKEIREAARGGRAAVPTLAYMPVPDLAEAGMDYVRFYFSRLVRYLGPLRDEPKPVYPIAGATDPGEVGFRGEHTAAVLDLHRNTAIRYVPSIAFVHEREPIQPVAATLRDAVLDWLEYLGVAHEIATADRGKLGHDLKVAVGEAHALHDLTHVGVGVSQVLPILVLALLAEAGSTLIFEQPELHLHPRVQARLADFFVSVTAVGKQCVIETHSEYLINRLRYRAAVAEGNGVTKDVLVYFVEKSGQRSKYRPIEMTEFGGLTEWPAGFFDESQSTAAAILKAAMAKRNSKKRG